VNKVTLLVSHFMELCFFRWFSFLEELKFKISERYALIAQKTSIA